MDKLTLAIIFGGCSTEHGVSLQSASAVIRALNHSKYNVVMIGIDRGGSWFRFSGAVEKIASDTWCNDIDCKMAFISPSRGIHGIVEFDGITRVDVAFPVLHGKNGEDGTVQGLLELAGIPIVGCDALSSALCMDKSLAHIAAKKAGVKVPRGVVFEKTWKIQNIIEDTDSLTYPLFVKPVRAGSSFGVSCVKHPKDLESAILTAFEHDSKIIVEEKIAGFEVGCSIIGCGGTNLTIGELDEIEIAGDLFDFTEKYALKTSIIHMPARITWQKTEEIKATAERIYCVLGCRVFARVDMFLTPSGEIVFNEVNTIPGFTEHSRFPNMMKGIGYSFGAVIDKLIELTVAI